MNRKRVVLALLASCQDGEGLGHWVLLDPKSFIPLTIRSYTAIW
jgi:hypothetical protein